MNENLHLELLGIKTVIRSCCLAVELLVSQQLWWGMTRRWYQSQSVPETLPY